MLIGCGVNLLSKVMAFLTSKTPNASALGGGIDSFPSDFSARAVLSLTTSSGAISKGD